MFAVLYHPVAAGDCLKELFRVLEFYFLDLFAGKNLLRGVCLYPAFVDYVLDLPFLELYGGTFSHKKINFTQCISTSPTVSCPPSL